MFQRCSPRFAIACHYTSGDRLCVKIEPRRLARLVNYPLALDLCYYQQAI
ncbi:hypothetical protein [Scytonema sp. HK-05]|nr:hypothetical protein [Scytonema sp. HK-05]